MALDRKDSRYKLDPDMHTALTVFSDADGITDGELTERVMAAYLRNRVHATTVAAAKLALAGITGNPRESSGTAGKRRE